MQSFNLSTARMKIKQISYVIFQARSQSFFKFCITLQCHDITSFSEIFQLKHAIYFGQKEPVKVQFFRLLSALVKVHPIPHATFETLGSGFIQILHHCPVS